MATGALSRVCLPLAAAIALAAGCSDSRPTEPEGAARPLPLQFRLDGTAASTEADGTTVSCQMDLVFDLAPNPRPIAGGLEYVGVHGGGLGRTVIDAAGNGISLYPDVHGNVVVRSLVPDRIEIEIPVNADTESRFWRELSLLRGVFGADGTATGGWRCAPFDIDQGGWVDTRYTAPGTWILTPV